MRYEPKKIFFEYIAHIKKSRDDTVCLWLSKPRTSLTQEIHSWNTSLVPSDEYEDSKGNTLLYYSFSKENSIDLRITVLATLWKRKFQNDNTQNVNTTSAEIQDSASFTTEELFLEQTLSVKQLAYELTKDASTPLEKISNIFTYVKETFSYVYPVKNRGVSHLDFSNLCGDCAEYAGLFVALCRVVGIPAKNITGFVINEGSAEPSEHGWASVYIDTMGWVDLDPQYASIEPSQNYFLETPDHRLAFTHGFNIPLNPQPSKEFSFQYWNTQGLPVTNVSAQTLQPLVFASKNDIVFVEKCNVKLT